MKIEKLRLKNWIGIKRGMGLDEIEVDFSDISGLVAFAGENGRGKSTLLENLSPYNMLASRSGALFNHVYGRAAEKELSFAYQGNHYRTLLKIDSQNGKSEGFVYKNGKSEVNGKISAYSKYIKDLLGSPEMFFASVFCSQNAKKLSDLTTGELKTLLSEFLNLNKLIEYEANAKDEITAVTGQIEQVDKQIMALGYKQTGIDTAKENLAREKEALSEHENAMDALKKKRVEYQAELDQLRDRKAKQEVLLANKANIEKQIETIKAQLFREQNDADAELNTLRDAYKALQAQIKENEDLLKQADEINTAAGKEKEIQEKLESDTKRLDTLTDETSSYLETYNKALLELNAIQATITQIQHDADKLENDDEIRRLKNDIKTAESQIDILQKRDADCQSSTCSFIVAALQAQEKLPALNKALFQREEEVFKLIDKLHGDHFENKSKWDDLASKTNGMKAKVDATDTEASIVRKGLANTRFDLTKVKDLAGKKTALAVAQSQYESVTKQMEENATKGKEIKVKWENRKADLDGSIKDAEVTAINIKQQIDNDIELRIIQVENAIGAVDAQLPITEKNLNESRANIMKLEAELSSMAAVEKELMEATAEKNALQHDIADWTYLKNACGKNGLQAMEIDGAAPIITNFANDLLTQAFGPLFTVKFRTINDEGKECLDIIVISDDGEEILLDNLSGGQRVWILMALRLAMTLLSKEKSGRNFETFYADELDGALDPENALNFVNMYRSFMTMGGFKDGYFISHKPSCRALADNGLMFSPGNNPAWQ